jgi:hypothetical protein
MSTSPQMNLRLTLVTTIAAMVAVLLVNWHIDPLRLKAPRGEETDLPASDSAPDGQEFWQKAFAVTGIKPAAVILGTSRADTGLDSAHAGFTLDARPVYNLALGGVDVAQMRDLLVHAQHARPLRMVVLGLDLEAFLPGGRADFDRAVLAGNAESAPEWMNRLRLNLSWHALRASAERLRPPQATRPLREVLIGNRIHFQIAELANFHSRLPQLFPRWDPGDEWSTDPQRAASMRAFRELVWYAREENIDLRVFISPVHARYLELYRRVGWWPLFESWKRALVTVLAEEAAERPGRTAYPLWDFSGFNAATMETLPPSADLTTGMRWFLDSSHYSREHGSLILDRVLSRPGEPADAPAIGVLLHAGQPRVASQARPTGRRRLPCRAPRGDHRGRTDRPVSAAFRPFAAMKRV